MSNDGNGNFNDSCVDLSGTKYHRNMYRYVRNVMQREEKEEKEETQLCTQKKKAKSYDFEG